MGVDQISVFMENREGRLAEMTKLLGERGINVRALFVADTADYGIARMIVDQPQKAIDVLKADGYTVNRTQVLAVEVPDRPGSLSGILSMLNEAKLNIEYLYCFADPERETALGIMRIEETERATELLRSSGVRVLEAEDVYSILK
ncbi:MAG: amino acid-binding protein [Actinobacteria bacterium]|nr:amino acid-binding protein [Actinomycetota bacterium]